MTYLVTWRARVSAIVAVVTAALTLSACGSSGNAPNTSGEPEHGGTLHLSLSEEVVTLDPLEAVDLPSVDTVSQISEPLFKVNPKGRNEPWLVEDYKQSSDQRIWTFDLRKGVTFSDGKPLNSADVLFTFERAKKSAYWSSLFEGVESFSAPFPSKFVVKTRKPASELPALLSQWSFGIIPRGFGGMTEKQFAQNPVGTGPFMLTSWKHGEALTLKRNRHYWKQGRPYLDEVVIQSVPNAESRVSQLKGGQLDVIYQPPWSQVELIDQTPGLEVGSYPQGKVESLLLNARDPLFQNKKVREAVNLALDREGIVNTSLAGEGQPAGSWLAPTVPYHDGSIEPSEQDLGRAKQLVAEAVKEGVSPSAALLNNPADPFWGSGGAAAQIVEQNLSEIGLKVSIRSVDEAGQLETLSNGEYDFSTLGFFDAIPSPQEPIGYYNGFEGLYTGASTAKTSKLAEEAASELDPSKREALWHEAQKVLDTEKFIIPVAYTPYPWATQSSLSGFDVGATGIPSLVETGFTK